MNELHCIDYHTKVEVAMKRAVESNPQHLPNNTSIHARTQQHAPYICAIFGLLAYITSY